MLYSRSKIGPFNKRIISRNTWIPSFNKIPKYIKPFSFFSFGQGNYGILGNGDTTNSYIPLEIVPGNTFSLINIGQENLVAVDSNGQLNILGNNNAYALGNDTNINSTTFCITSNYGSLIGRTVVKAFSLREVTVALDTLGKVHIWGNNYFGVFGNGVNTGISKVPIEISALSSEFIIDISLGAAQIFAITSTKVFGWGRNDYGQVGNGNLVDQLSPVDISSQFSGKTIVKVVGSAFYSCAIASDGSLYSWGWNQYGQLGRVSLTVQPTPTLVIIPPIIDISLGASSTIALTSTGEVYTFGSGTYGILGNNSTSNSSLPINISGYGALIGKFVTKIGAGNYHCIAISNDGSICGWGINNHGQLAQNPTDIFQSLIPILIGPLHGKDLNNISSNYSAYSSVLW